MPPENTPPVENTPAPTTPEAGDDFGKAFEDLAKLSDETTEDPPKPAPEPAPTPAADPELKGEEAPAQAQEKADGDGAAQDDPAGEAADGASDDQGQPEGDQGQDQGADPSDDELLQRFARLIKKAEPAADPKPAPAQQTQKEEPPPEPYTPEEKSFLQEYEKDWPDVAKAEALRRREEYKQLVPYIFQQVHAFYKPHLERLEALAQRTHIQELTQVVPDYNNISHEKVIEWVGKQPAYLQPAYQQVIEQGTAEEVADLVRRYKADTGGTVTSTPTPAKKRTELPTATKQAAAALAPVSSKRSGATPAIDPGDFDSAFAAAAEALKDD